MANEKNRIKVPHHVIVKIKGLLPMMYTIREMSEELDTPVGTLRDWLSFGAPCERDSRDHIWIYGVAFAGWLDEQRKKKRTFKLQSNEAYCLKCREVSKLLAPETRHIKGNLYMVKGTCEQCGSVINRGASCDRKTKLQAN